MSHMVAVYAVELSLVTLDAVSRPVLSPTCVPHMSACIHLAARWLALSTWHFKHLLGSFCSCLAHSLTCNNQSITYGLICCCCCFESRNDVHHALSWGPPLCQFDPPQG